MIQSHLLRPCLSIGINHQRRLVDTVLASWPANLWRGAYVHLFSDLIAISVEL